MAAQRILQIYNAMVFDILPTPGSLFYLSHLIVVNDTIPQVKCVEQTISYYLPGD